MESVENQKKDLEKKVEVMAQRLRELEKTQESDRKEMNQYKVGIECNQYINLSCIQILAIFIMRHLH